METPWTSTVQVVTSTSSSLSAMNITQVIPQVPPSRHIKTIQNQHPPTKMIGDQAGQTTADYPAAQL